jgi:hypothetical protein
LPGGISGQWGEGAQLDRLSKDTQLVTLSIGGNDAGFPFVLPECVHATGIYAPIQFTFDFSKRVFAGGCQGIGNAYYKYAHDLLLNGGHVYVLADGSTVPINPRVTGRQVVDVPSLAAIIEKIHKLSPVAKILVLGYPRLFPASPTQDCLVGHGALPGSPKLVVRASDAAFLNTLGDNLDDLIVDHSVILAQAAGVPASLLSFVDPRFTFEGHSVCSQSPWLNGALFAARFTTTASVFSFHPNKLGQAAFAQLIERAAGFKVP